MASRLSLAALAAAIFALPACPGERGRPLPAGRDAEAAPERPPRPPSDGAGAHLPYPSAAGWSMSEPAELYGRGDLERLVDGGADRYRRFGYRAAAAAEYRRADLPRAALRVEVFDMGSRLSAFGLLASEIAELRDPTAAESPGVIELGEAATLGVGALTFYRGSLLVRLVLQDLSPDATEESLDALGREHLPGVARQLARALPGSSAPPEELGALPAEGRVRRSEQLHPEHLLGIEALGPGVSALYGDPGPRLRLGLPLPTGEERARASFAALAAALAEAAPLAEVGEEAAAGRIEPLGQVVVARRGATLAVAAAARAAERPRAGSLEALARAALTPPAQAGASAPRPTEP